MIRLGAISTAWVTALRIANHNVGQVLGLHLLIMQVKLLPEVVLWVLLRITPLDRACIRLGLLVDTHCIPNVRCSATGAEDRIDVTVCTLSVVVHHVRDLFADWILWRIYGWLG